MHIYITAGFRSLPGKSDPVHILEVGLGTGLNALLTLIEGENPPRAIFYDAIEPFPPALSLTARLNYLQRLGREDLEPVFRAIHSSPAEIPVLLNPLFSLRKFCKKLEEMDLMPSLYDLVYFDAFSPNAQPELWHHEVFDTVKNVMKPGGILVTYCARGSVSRAMETAGFTVQKLPGPPGKRHIIRAIRN